MEAGKNIEGTPVREGKWVGKNNGVKDAPKTKEEEKDYCRARRTNQAELHWPKGEQCGGEAGRQKWKK